MRTGVGDDVVFCWPEQDASREHIQSRQRAQRFRSRDKTHNQRVFTAYSYREDAMPLSCLEQAHPCEVMGDTAS